MDRLTIPAYTPYDGTSKPFTIGLKPLDLATWIEVDEFRDESLAEKRHLYATVPNLVFVEEPDTRAAQQEVLDLLTAHMAHHFPHLPTAIDPIEPPLKSASLLVQEDLILMRRGEKGWRLTAGSLCFPSHWNLVEKFGLAMHDIHRPVPDFGEGTRNAGLIDRMFDSLSPGRSVERFNWSIQAGGERYRPFSHLQREQRAAEHPSKFNGGDIDVHAFMRVERQTLRKLPVSGDILFTIRIYLDPLRVLANHPDRATLAPAFADQLMSLDEAQLSYKGLNADRERLAQFLRSMA